jgi:flagellar assembly protein FliH
VAGIIKREDTATARHFSFADLEAEARHLLDNARREAQAVVQRAEHQAAARVAAQRQAAHEEGLRAGRTAGLEAIHREARAAVYDEYRARFESALAALTTGLREFEQHKRHLLAQAERGLITLALAVARRVCKTLPERSAAAAIANVRGVLELTGNQGDLELRVNPAELATLTDWTQAFVAECGRLTHVNLVADETVTQGGCVLRGREVTIDATIEGQLDRVAAALLDADTDAPGDEEAV